MAGNKSWEPKSRIPRKDRYAKPPKATEEMWERLRKYQELCRKSQAQTQIAKSKDSQ